MSKLTIEEQDFIIKLSRDDQEAYFALPSFSQTLIMRERTFERRKKKLSKYRVSKNSKRKNAKRRWNLLKNSLVEVATLEKEKARRNLKRGASDTPSDIQSKKKKYAAIAMASNQMNDYMLAQILAFGGKSAINRSLRDKIEKIKIADRKFIRNLSLSDDEEIELLELELELLKDEDHEVEQLLKKEIADDEAESDRLYRELAAELDMDADGTDLASKFLLDTDVLDALPVDSMPLTTRKYNIRRQDPDSGDEGYDTAESGDEGYDTADDEAPPTAITLGQRAVSIDIVDFDDLVEAPAALVVNGITQEDYAEALQAGIDAAVDVLTPKNPTPDELAEALQAGVAAAKAVFRRSQPTLDGDAIAAGVEAARRVLQQILVYRCPTNYPKHCPSDSRLLRSNPNGRGYYYPCAKQMSDCELTHAAVKRRLGRRDPASRSCGLSALDNNGYGRTSYMGDKCDEENIQRLVRGTGVRDTSPVGRRRR